MDCAVAPPTEGGVSVTPQAAIAKVEKHNARMVLYMRGTLCSNYATELHRLE
jgi:hypothetical protein